MRTDAHGPPVPRTPPISLASSSVPPFIRRPSNTVAVIVLCTRLELRAHARIGHQATEQQVFLLFFRGQETMSIRCYVDSCQTRARRTNSRLPITGLKLTRT